MSQNNGDDIAVKLKRAKQASLKMQTLTTEQKNLALKEFALLIEKNKESLLSKNQKDLDESEGKIGEALFQRLKLSERKIQDIVSGINDLVKLDDPCGQELKRTQLNSDMTLVKRSVPIGVIGVVFESRPDVNPQILSLILKSGNCVVLKGGSEAHHSNLAFEELVLELNRRCDFLPEDWAQIITTREDFSEMLKYNEYLDLVVPRGSNELVQTVMQKTKAPVLGHADGICHIYVDEDVSLDDAIKVVTNAKVQYPSACNALETLLLHKGIAKSFLKEFSEIASKEKIELRGCEESVQLMPNIKKAKEEDWRTEYGDLILSIRIVDSLEGAIEHINTYGSHHTDAILTNQKEKSDKFLGEVDSACVFVNASTRFADGFRFGMGAEIGISTSKTHARGPVGLEGLVIYKYELSGNYKIVD